MNSGKRRWFWLIALAVAVVAFPPHWYPLPLRLTLTAWFGAADYRALPSSVDARTLQPETFCPADPSGWRAPQTIEGVAVAESLGCVADNPLPWPPSSRGRITYPSRRCWRAS